MPQRADGQKISQLITDLAQREGRRITFSEVCRRTFDLGNGFVAIEERTLNRARNSERIDEAYLKSLAKVLGVDLSSLVLQDPAEKTENERQVRSGENHQTLSVAGDESDGINAAPGAHVSVNRQTYRRDRTE